MEHRFMGYLRLPADFFFLAAFAFFLLVLAVFEALDALTDFFVPPPKALDQFSAYFFVDPDRVTVIG